jgi:Fe-Mn family superoxide dismutase
MTIHQLPTLAYAYDALEPFIDARTMEIHHTKHHQTYIDKLNAALEGHVGLQSRSAEALLQELTMVPENIHGGPQPRRRARQPQPLLAPP